MAASAAFDPDCRWNKMINAVGTYISGAELERVSALDFDNYADSAINWRVREGYGTAIAAHGEGLLVTFSIVPCCRSITAAGD